MTPPNAYLLRAMYEWLVDNNVTPYIVITPKTTGVKVPSEFLNTEHLTLNIGPRASRNMQITKEKLTCDTTFHGAIHRLEIPIVAIASIYAKENNVGMVFLNEHVEPKGQSAESKTPPATNPPNLFAVPKLRIIPETNKSSATKASHKRHSATTRKKPKLVLLEGDELHGKK